MSTKAIANKTHVEITLVWSKDSLLFNNFNSSKCEKDGVTYCGIEHCLTYHEALLFKDLDAQIMEPDKPARMKHICVWGNIMCLLLGRMYLNMLNCEPCTENRGPLYLVLFSEKRSYAQNMLSVWPGWWD